MRAHVPENMDDVIAESALEDCQVQASHTAPISAILVRTAQLPTPAREECDLTGEPGSYRQGKERPFYRPLLCAAGLRICG